jgi:hypothetical protein
MDRPRIKEAFVIGTVLAFPDLEVFRFGGERHNPTGSSQIRVCSEHKQALITHYPETPYEHVVRRFSYQLARLFRLVSE